MPKKKRAFPGRSERVGLTVFELFEKFPSELSARRWFESVLWGEGRYCGHCGGTRTKEVPNEKPMPYWCGECRSYFSVKTGTPMQSSKIPLRKWAVAVYMMTTSLKGVSSTKMHRELGITQSCAWHMIHRIREAWNQDLLDRMAGVVEVDETYVGGKERNKHASKKLNAGRGAVGKTAVVGAKERGSRKVVAKPVSETDKSTLQGFVADNVETGSTVFTDEARAYLGMVDFEHSAVKHAAKEFVNGMAHTNGIESFWAMLKRGYMGTYHQMSVKHLHRYVNEFAGRHNIRELDTIDQMASVVKGMDGKRLKYDELIS